MHALPAWPFLLHRYSIDVTPSIKAISPATGSSGTKLTVTGVNMAGVTGVRFIQGDVRAGVAPKTFANATTATFTVPALPSGVYSIVLVKDNREMSVDPFRVRRVGCGEGLGSLGLRELCRGCHSHLYTALP